MEETIEAKKTIYTKLLEFQKLGISVKKDGKNPHFKSSYATLNEVLDKVTEPLNTLGMVIVFSPEADGLRTLIVDTESGEKIESFMKYVGIDNAQKLLACNTYFRRGSLVALLGLSDEDDDGTKASTPVYKPAPAPVKKLTTFQVAQKQIALADTEEKVNAVLKKIADGKNLTDEEKEALYEEGSRMRDEILLGLSEK